MTFEKLLEDLLLDKVTVKETYSIILSKEKMKTINYFVNRNRVSTDPLRDEELSQLNAIVGILQILYSSSTGSPISDNDYDILQEMLVDMGIPRLTGSVEVNNLSKVSHQYTSLRGTLSKIYYLNSDEQRTNKSRKYLDDWIKSQENKYEKNTGNKINLNDQKVLLTPKYDGGSCVLEIRDKKYMWLTRGDTDTNKASDVSHIMRIFNDLYSEYNNCAIQFEVMCSEENKDKINDLYRDKSYRNSRQVVTSALNSKEIDFKADYIYPIPLRVMKQGDQYGYIHEDMINKFPNHICKLSDRDDIKEFANDNRYVKHNNMRFRTDGVVITILDPKIQSVLGRDNDINNFEVAFKHTEEIGFTKIKDVEFNNSNSFGYFTPVLVVNDVILKGNRINHISLSNKERFDELNPHVGQSVIVRYDIIPYVTKDDRPNASPGTKRIQFITHCPRCKNELDLEVVQVQCRNPKCPSRLLGKIINYCTNLNMENIGYQTLETLYDAGLLNKGIRSLYKLKKKTLDIESLDGFGRLKTKKIIKEIENKRYLKDYEFFGSIGIEGMSTKTFKSIFAAIKYQEFIDMISFKNFDMMFSKLVTIEGMADKRSQLIVNYFREPENREEIKKLIQELRIEPTYGTGSTVKGVICFTGIRPDKELHHLLIGMGYEVTDSWSNKVTHLIIPRLDYESNKVIKAADKGIKIISLDSGLTEVINQIKS
jgi:NAD-dependent DNA ligase